MSTPLLALVIGATRHSKAPKAPPAPSERVIVRKWNRPQSDFLKAVRKRQARLINLEGGIRSGKTTAGIWALITLAIEYPGIKMFLCRWTGDSLDLQLKPKFYEECPKELFGRPENAPPKTQKNGWNEEEECQYFKNGSMLYLRSLKSSDDKARFAKFTGLTLAVVVIDQPEEVPEDIYHALKGRLSQPGFPQMMILLPNPPAYTHWICKEFPEDNSVEGHLYFRISLYDNREIIGEEYIQELEREYPPGHAMRRRMIDGRRGLSIEGEAVYKHSFSRDTHVRDVQYFPDFPVFEAWDFGQRHPAVSWHQLLPWGHWNILGEYMGSSEYIDQTVPIVATLRAELFPGPIVLRVCCDPSGAQGQGARHTCVEVLNDHLRETYGPGNSARYMTNSNRPEQRGWAIQQIASYMSRLTRGRPALLVNPRCITIIDGFEAGYVYDDRAVLTGSRLPNYRRPRKDGTYDHLMNTCEYLILCYGNSPIQRVDQSRLTHRQRLHLLQQDTDEVDDYRVSRLHRNRAGY